MKAENIFPMPSLKVEPELRDSLVQEFHEASVTIATNAATVDVATDLNEVLGISLCTTVAGSDDVVHVNTTGTITAGKVTVNVATSNIADGALKVRFFLLGKILPVAPASAY